MIGIPGDGESLLEERKGGDTQKPFLGLSGMSPPPIVGKDKHVRLLTDAAEEYLTFCPDDAKVNWASYLTYKIIRSPVW